MEQVTLQDAITASGRYPERLTHKELTPEIKTNLMLLLKKVNDVLTELGIKKVTVSSGWRPSSVNATTKGSAKKSLHISGMAIDLAGHEVYNALVTKPELLKKYSLWMESALDATNWSHIDMGTRADRPLRVFRA